MHALTEMETTDVEDECCPPELTQQVLDACDVESKARMVVLGAKLAHAEATVALRDAELAQNNGFSLYYGT